jgi:hypothetical protein
MPNKTVLAILVALTALNISSTGRPDHATQMISSFNLNESLPELQLRGVGCRAIVAFRSSCPFCGAAADREHEATVGRASVPTTWIAPADDLGWQSYVGRVGSGSTVTTDPTLFRRLKVQGVPAAFLVDAEGVIRWIWPYRGNEDTDSLLAKCTPPVSR